MGFRPTATVVEAADALSFTMLVVTTDTMPPSLRAMSDHQPITPVIETVGDNGWITLA